MQQMSVLQVSEAELVCWCQRAVGLRAELAAVYAKSLLAEGYDSAAALALAEPHELSKMRIRTGHARLMIAHAESLKTSAPAAPAAPAAAAAAVEEIVEVSIDEARATTAAALRKIGWDEQDAALQAEIMTAAELCGNNQGLVKMYQPQLMAPARDASKPVVERQTDTSAVINANQSPGMLAAVMAADLAADKALRKGPISIVGAYNTSTSSGQLAYYAGRMAERGLIGIALANSPEFVAAGAGGKAVFGTNPIALGFPRASAPPLTFDMATSAIALFGVLTAKAKGELLPRGVAFGKDGEFTTDASEVLEGGAIATFGGHKGAGLALSVELLAGALSGGAVLGQCESKKAAKSWGHTLIAIEPSALVEDFERKVASILKAVKDSGESIRLPGENSAKIAIERKKTGKLPIAVKIWESIVTTAEQGLPTS
uniref:Malate dehydrogenase n=1 Tax=Calcidiscus leptoporus TaxID=127549 RepID=A0A7S0JH47_9EUKA